MDQNRVKTSDRLKQIMQERNLKQADILRLIKPIAQKYGDHIGSNALSQYVKGKVEPRQGKLFILSQALNVSEAWLMGFDVPRERENRGELPADVPGILPIRRKAFPLLGEIACGEPAFSEEQYETDVIATEDVDADFCVRARGDSMTGAHIDDGDVVFIKQMPVVENGEIAAVCVDGETTLKYVDYRPESAVLILTPANPEYRTQIYTGEQLDAIRILGAAVIIQKRVRHRK